MPTKTARTDNPIDNDDRLKNLLSEISTVQSQKNYSNWQKKFLKIYTKRLDKNCILNGKDANYRLLKQLEKLDNRIQLVQAQLLQTVADTDATDEDVATATATATAGLLRTANGKRLLTNLTQEVVATEVKVQEFLPKTAADEERFGFDKFELGAVLLEDAFYGYDKMKASRKVLESIADQLSRYTNSDAAAEIETVRNEITILKQYADTVESFVRVMEDLKLVSIMNQCVDVVYCGKERPAPKPPPPPGDDDDDEEDDDDEDDDSGNDDYDDDDNTNNNGSNSSYYEKESKPKSKRGSRRKIYSSGDDNYDDDGEDGDGDGDGDGDDYGGRGKTKTKKKKKKKSSKTKERSSRDLLEKPPSSPKKKKKSKKKKTGKEPATDDSDCDDSGPSEHNNDDPTDERGTGDRKKKKKKNRSASIQEDPSKQKSFKKKKSEKKKNKNKDLLKSDDDADDDGDGESDSDDGPSDPRGGPQDEEGESESSEEEEEEEEAGQDGPPPESEFLLYFDPKTNTIGRIDRKDALSKKSGSLLVDPSKEGDKNGAYAGEEYLNVINDQTEKDDVFFLLKKVERQKPEESSWLDEIKKEKAAAAANGTNKTNNNNNNPRKLYKSTALITKRHLNKSPTGTNKKTAAGKLGNNNKSGSSPSVNGKKKADLETMSFQNPLDDGGNNNSKKRTSFRTGKPPLGMLSPSKEKRPVVRDYRAKYQQVADKPGSDGWSKVSSRNL